MDKRKLTVFLAAFMTVLVTASTGFAQTPAAAPQAGRGRGGRGGRGPQVISPEVFPDRRVTFRILAPQAQSVRLNATDFPALAPDRGAPPETDAATPPQPRAGQLTKAENGVWEFTIGPVDPGAYRYNFVVDGVSVTDPRSPNISESNTNVWSIVYVPGDEFMDTREVPHGAVAAVTYYSTALKRFRRMHVYTPPGYETNNQKYPVFYLLHGAGDNDESWTSVGRAGFILDNLIAGKKARPMIVVMPAGHTSAGFGGRGGGRGASPAAREGAAAGPPDEFAQDFMTDLMPYAETHYRVLADRPHRAIAGLSMGGSQTLDIAFRKLEKFAYVGVFSSGVTLGGGRGRGRGAAAGSTTPPAPQPPPPPDWETIHKSDLENAALKKGTKLIWMSTGVDDTLIANSRSTVELLQKHGFDPVFKESPGAHTWINWRNYLYEFAPQLFQ